VPGYLLTNLADILYIISSQQVLCLISTLYFIIGCLSYWVPRATVYPFLRICLYLNILWCRYPKKYNLGWIKNEKKGEIKFSFGNPIEGNGHYHLLGCQGHLMPRKVVFLWQKGFCKGDVNPAPSFIFPECSRIDLLQRCTSNQHCYLYRVEILLKLASLSYLFVIRQIQSPTNPCTLSYYWKDEVGEVQLFCFQRRILNCIQ